MAPLERREIRIKIFGIDPSATTAAFGTNNAQTIRNRAQPLISNYNDLKTGKNINDRSLGEEHRVYVRRHTSTSLNTEFKSTIFSFLKYYF